MAVTTPVSYERCQLGGIRITRRIPRLRTLADQNASLMVTCLVWAAVLVVVVLLILVVFWSMIVGAFPIWPPIAVAVVTFRILTRPRIPTAFVRLVAALSVLALAIDLPTAVPNYFLAMRELGYTGSFGSAIGAAPVDWVRLLDLGLPLCILGGAAIGSSLAAVRRPRTGGGEPRRSVLAPAAERVAAFIRTARSRQPR